MPVDDTSIFSFSPTCWVLAILARLGNVGVVNVKPGRPSRWRATSQGADGPVAESAHARTMVGTSIVCGFVLECLGYYDWVQNADQAHGDNLRISRTGRRMSAGTWILRCGAFLPRRFSWGQSTCVYD